MGSYTNYLENKVLDHVLGKTAFTMPATVYAALFTAAPGEAAGGTECSGTGYARVDCTGLWNAAASGSSSNASDITFAQAGAGGWGTVTHFALFDAITAGNMLMYGTLTASRAVAEGDTVRFEGGTPGDLVVTQD